MHLIAIMASLALLLALTLITLAFIVGKKNHTNREKFTPFECGFDPNKKARAPFSLRFFLITVLFLIFDVELSLLLPLGLLTQSSEPLNIIFASSIVSFILIIGLLHEWNQGVLTWVI
uniref:NADH dehydrogenase subunit 3 n=1 Tax=Gammarus nipponensis TaxID=353628 RepID=UPI00286B8BA9|nr:NADH dehydrogenase subunit 3 [Gammarus nipponensis]WLS55462.1 NADH dehydrogenase subunit 3 [Gammarus nipponensis]